MPRSKTLSASWILAKISIWFLFSRLFQPSTATGVCELMPVSAGTCLITIPLQWSPACLYRGGDSSSSSSTSCGWVYFRHHRLWGTAARERAHAQLNWRYPGRAAAVAYSEQGIPSATLWITCFAIRNAQFEASVCEFQLLELHNKYICTNWAAALYRLDKPAEISRDQRAVCDYRRDTKNWHTKKQQQKYIYTIYKQAIIRQTNYV